MPSDVRIEHAQQRIEVAFACGSEERVDDRASGGQFSCGRGDFFHFAPGPTGGHLCGCDGSIDDHSIVLWTLAGVLALAFGVGGASQIILTKERYRSLGSSQHWVDDFGAGHVKAIGTIKIVGVIGLVVPPLVGVLPFLSPLAACGLMLVMAGAATTRFRRSEWGRMVGDVAFLLAFAFLAWGRFSLAPFGG